MPRGKNYVNNNKGMVLQSSKKSQQMMECFYGTGCTRPDCVYRHPPKKTADKNNNDKSSNSNNQSREPCMAFLAGFCTFDKATCRKRHPPKQEVAMLIAKYEKIPCRYGNQCLTKGCLYRHEQTNNNNEIDPTLPSQPPQRIVVASARGATAMQMSYNQQQQQRFQQFQHFQQLGGVPSSSTTGTIPSTSTTTTTTTTPAFISNSNVVNPNVAHRYAAASVATAASAARNNMMATATAATGTQQQQQQQQKQQQIMQHQQIPSNPPRLMTTAPVGAVTVDRPIPGSAWKSHPLPVRPPPQATTTTTTSSSSSTSSTTTATNNTMNHAPPFYSSSNNSNSNNNANIKTDGSQSQSLSASAKEWKP